MPLSFTLEGQCQLCGAHVHVVQNDLGDDRWMDDTGSVYCTPGVYHEPDTVRVVMTN